MQLGHIADEAGDSPGSSLSQHPDQGGLAGTLDPEEAEAQPRWHLEGETIEYLQIIEAEGFPIYLHCKLGQFAVPDARRTAC